MAVRAAVAGASGYAGGELLRLLLAHPEVEIGALTGASNAGQRLGALQPHLLPLADRVLEPTTPEALAGHDVVFLALPHGESAAVAEQLGDEVLVIDMGADFRLKDAADWEAFYGSPHAGTWPYGLPELPGARAALEGSKRVAVPGCLPDRRVPRPLSRVRRRPRPAGGRGRRRLRHLRRGQVAQAAPAGQRGHGLHDAVRRGRRAPAHPEMIQNLSAAAGERVTVSFTPTLAPMPRGILATCTVKAKQPGVTAESVRAAYEKAFADEPFVRLLPEGQWPATASVYGSNAVQVQVAYDAAAGRIIAISAIDNLTKGTAGGAVQREPRPGPRRGHGADDDRSRAVSDARAAAGPQTTTMPAPLRCTGGRDISRYRGGANEETQ
ncbi:N-acetyl-gamma-glutamyl-phosphate reductase OS=Streptomyces tendae OX=1932 GN=argC PE=3 SV=1 [Streptomyces tendae]